MELGSGDGIGASYSFHGRPTRGDLSLGEPTSRIEGPFELSTLKLALARVMRC